MGNGTDNKDSLQSINIQPRRPVNYAPNAEAEQKAHILEFYNKGDWETVAESCTNGISSFIKDLPTPILTGIRIYYFYSLLYHKISVLQALNEDEKRSLQKHLLKNQ